MSQQPLITERLIDAPVALVWAALTEPERMRAWYFDVDDFKPEVGFEFRFEGCGREGEKYLHICKVLEVVPGRKLVHTWCYDGFPGQSVVMITLEEEGGGTKLVLTHAGLETFDQTNDSFARNSFEAGWTEIIGTSLPAYLAK